MRKPLRCWPFPLVKKLRCLREETPIDSRGNSTVICMWREEDDFPEYGHAGTCLWYPMRQESQWQSPFPNSVTRGQPRGGRYSVAVLRLHCWRYSVFGGRPQELLRGCLKVEDGAPPLLSQNLSRKLLRLCILIRRQESLLVLSRDLIAEVTLLSSPGSTADVTPLLYWYVSSQVALLVSQNLIAEEFRCWQSSFTIDVPRWRFPRLF